MCEPLEMEGKGKGRSQLVVSYRIGDEIGVLIGSIFIINKVVINIGVQLATHHICFLSLDMYLVITR